jgi:hypothetical protein
MTMMINLLRAVIACETEAGPRAEGKINIFFCCNSHAPWHLAVVVVFQSLRFVTELFPPLRRAFPTRNGVKKQMFSRLMNHFLEPIGNLFLSLVNYRFAQLFFSVLCNKHKKRGRNNVGRSREATALNLA